MLPTLGRVVHYILLDGTDLYWAMSRSEGDEQGRWHWPPRA